ncbi:hypothetical protein SAMN05428953_1198 [Mesorhizobium muleiense]|uniref:Uncharacterized protein n=1 Tax=Mesorhizobium muleiense TaxID=1004279 RepID=A0A1G9DZ37_9HYPH|nr:hypothetical protein SAMN05428953_1198 [Mesorhizobium muleiense]
MIGLCQDPPVSRGRTGGSRWRRKGLMTARVRCLHRWTSSADEKPNGCNPEHQAKYRKKQPTCLVNAGVHCSLLSRCRHRNDASRSSVPTNSPISAFCHSGPGPKHCLGQPMVGKRPDRSPSSGLLSREDAVQMYPGGKRLEGTSTRRKPVSLKRRNSRAFGGRDWSCRRGVRRGGSGPLV